MKIALIHYRLIRRGGLETRLLNYLHHFHQLGHEVSIYCAKWDKSIDLPSDVEVFKVNLGIMLKPFRAWYFDQKIIKVLAKATYDFALSLGRTSFQDAVLMPGGHLGYLEALGKRKSSISDFMQIHLDRKAYKNSQLIYAASSMMRTELVEQYQVAEEKIKLLYPPLNTQKYNQELRPKRQILRQELDIADGKIAFAFVSSSHFRKGLDILLEVFEKLDPERYELLIVGMPAVKSRLKNVRYIGFLNELRTLYTAVDFMILPARYEPFGQVVSESLQCGTPVMISHQVGAKDVVRPEMGLVVSSLSPAQWVEAIRANATKKFEIPADFSQEMELSLEEHVAKMLDHWFLNS